MKISTKEIQAFKALKKITNNEGGKFIIETPDNHDGRMFEFTTEQPSVDQIIKDENFNCLFTEAYLDSLSKEDVRKLYANKKIKFTMESEKSFKENIDVVYENYDIEDIPSELLSKEYVTDIVRKYPEKKHLLIKFIEDGKEVIDALKSMEEEFKETLDDRQYNILIANVAMFLPTKKDTVDEMFDIVIDGKTKLDSADFILAYCIDAYVFTDVVEDKLNKNKIKKLFKNFPQFEKQLSEVLVSQNKGDHLPLIHKIQYGTLEPEELLKKSTLNTVLKYVSEETELVKLLPMLNIALTYNNDVDVIKNFINECLTEDNRASRMKEYKEVKKLKEKNESN